MLLESPPGAHTLDRDVVTGSCGRPVAAFVPGTRHASGEGMTKSIKVDGRTMQVFNSYSSGPGCPTHTYDLAYGAWVTQIGHEWKLHTPGRAPRIVTVSL